MTGLLKLAPTLITVIVDRYPDGRVRATATVTREPKP